MVISRLLWSILKNMFSLFLCISVSKVRLSHSEECKFIQWMRTNNKFYTGDDYHFRLGIYLSNIRYCQEFNRRKGLTFRIEANKFACHTPSEYKAILGSQMISPNNYQKYAPKANVAIPDSFDWRDKGVVNPIKNQVSCGSCWAFSVISTSETAHAIATTTLFQFSEQNLVDCVTTCYGCNGGWPSLALTYIIDHQNGQFNSEDDYQYTDLDGKCVYKPNKAIGKITSFVNVKEGDEIDLKEKVATLGVASVCVSAGNYPFMSYASGILDDEECSGATVDHAVNVVGYGVENEVEFWIVRNSWGDDWGEDGYLRLVRNKNNMCSIASVAVIAIDSE